VLHFVKTHMAWKGK